MSESWGGSRTPANPAPVSGVGANSARTDGGVMNPNSPSYGEVADVQSLQQAAPMAGAAGAAPGPAGPVAPPSFTGLGEPSQDQLPVTAGVPLGAGPGAEALGLPLDPAQELKADARSLGPQLRVMLAAAERPEATPSFRRYVRQVVANL